MDKNVELAVLCSLDPSSDLASKTNVYSSKLQALEYCESLKTVPSSVPVAIKLFMSQTSDPQVRFFCLQLIEHHITVGVSETALQELIEMATLYFMSGQTDPQYLKNKFASVVSCIFISSYLSKWTTFFEAFLKLSVQPFGINLFLLICLAIDQHIKEARYSATITKERMLLIGCIKDRVREHDSTALVKFWLSLLNSIESFDSQIASNLLKCVASFYDWLDISLFDLDSLVPLLYKLLGTEVYSEAAECLIAIVSKGMPPADKIKLIEALGVDQFLMSNPFTDEKIETCYRILSSVGTELCVSIDEMNSDDVLSYHPKAIEILNVFGSLLMRFLAINDLSEVSGLVPFAGTFIETIKAIHKKDPKPVSSMLESFLKAIIPLLRLPEVDMDLSSDEGVHFTEMRESCKVMMEGIVFMCPDLVGSVFALYISSFIESRIECDVELGLFLLISLAGFNSFSPKFISEGVETPLLKLITKAINSQIASLNCKAIQLHYFEVVIRYSHYQLFADRPDLLRNAILPFINQSGIHSRNVEIFCRSSYLLLKLVRDLKKLIHPFANDILVALNDLLVVDKEVNQADSSIYESRLYLFELFGLLIASEVFHVEAKAQYINYLKENIFSVAKLALENRENPSATHTLRNSIMAFGAMSKGFADSECEIVPEELVPIFHEIGKMILFTMQVEDKNLRVALIYSLQRMIGLKGAKIYLLLFDFTRDILPVCTAEELQSFLIFFSSVLHRFQAEIVSTLDASLIPIVQKTVNFLSIPISGTDDVILHNDLLKNFVAFLLSIFAARLQSIFLSSSNSSILVSLVETVLQFTLKSDNMSVRKQGLSLFSKMISEWCASNLEPIENFVPGFDQFIYQHIFAMCFEFNVPISSKWTVVLSELASIQKIFIEKRGMEFYSFMEGRLSEFQSQSVQKYLTSLKSDNLKSFKKVYTDFFLELHQK